jgi:hypothetical protein
MASARATGFTPHTEPPLARLTMSTFLPCRLALMEGSFFTTP